MADGLKLRTDAGWRKFERALNAQKFRQKLHAKKGKALDKVARVIVREAIAAGGFAKNAALTQAIKGGAVPLQDTGKQLVKAIRTRREGDKLFVGVPFNHAFYKKARAIHDGSIAKVTPKMREMFILLWLASNDEISSRQLTGRAAELFKRKKKGWLPLKSETRVIKIPARRFMAEAFGSDASRQAMEMIFTKAVNQTLAQLAR
jgi:hypothetical protein